MAECAVLGVGRIGTALLRRLVAAGHTVTAHDPLPERRQHVAAAGARWAPGVAEAVGGAEVVLTVLPGNAELRSLALDRDDLLPHIAEGGLWIDVTSTAPDVSRACARLARGRGVALVDAPLAGGVSAVTDGTATLYLGGDLAAVERARPVLAAFAASTPHVGAGGSGHLAKLLINTAWFGQAVLVTELLLLGQEQGLAPDLLQQLMTGSAADSAFVRDYVPRLLEGDYVAEFGLDRCVEELDAVRRAAAAGRAPHTVIDAVTGVHRRALEEYGAVDGELLAAAWLEQQAGHTLGSAGRGPRRTRRPGAHR